MLLFVALVLGVGLPLVMLVVVVVLYWRQNRQGPGVRG